MVRGNRASGVGKPGSDCNDYENPEVVLSWKSLRSCRLLSLHTLGCMYKVCVSQSR